MSYNAVSTVGIAWFCLEEYDQLRGMFVDGEGLPETYQEWLDKAQGLFEHLIAKGYRVEKVPIELVDFPVWCQRKGMSMSSKARSQYANDFIALKQLKNDRPK